MRYSITYASNGHLPDISGELRIFVDARLGPMPTVIETSGRAILLDPRAIIREAGGRVVYTPRDYPLDTHTKAMREWLVNHPEWAAHDE